MGSWTQEEIEGRNSLIIEFHNPIIFNFTDLYYITPVLLMGSWTQEGTEGRNSSLAQVSQSSRGHPWRIPGQAFDPPRMVQTLPAHP